jgi:predicted XRE-type DNA-binding protein
MNFLPFVASNITIQKPMSEGLKQKRGSGNVFRDLGFSRAQAENLQLRSRLMMRIEQYCLRRSMSKSEASMALGLSQRRLQALFTGKIERFSL